MLDNTQGIVDPGFEASEEAQIPEEIAQALRQLKDTLYTEERSIRDRQYQQWRQNDAMWKGIHNAIYLSVARDITTISELRDIPGLQNLTDEENRIINIFRAHGEAIIAALSANIPYAVFSPEDADNPDDISTAKAYRKSADLIEIQQEAALKITKGLYYLYLYGITFSYNLYHKDKSYGTIKRPLIDYKMIDQNMNVCNDCGDSVEAEGSSVDMMGYQCTSCGSLNTAQETQQQQVPYVQQVNEDPKGRSLIEIYGPLHVTVPHFVRSLDQAGYLRLDTDLDMALVKEIYPGLKVEAKTDINRVQRTPADQLVFITPELCTVTRQWFRPWMFNRVRSDELREKLKALFPSGCYAVFVNDEFAEACEENMDDVWTTSLSAISEHIHADPICNPIKSIQVMLTELINLTMETIESGISLNFADPAILDLKALNETTAKPGGFLPVKAVKSGVSLESSFYSTKPATLSQEVAPFTQYLEKSGQFVLGSFPTIFGGNQETGSKTLGEYKESKETALQRLSLPWKSISSFWMHTIHKAVKLFVQNLEEDEKFTKPTGNNSFTNVWIRESELKGKVGTVFVENSEQLPVTWSQKRAMVLDFIQQNNPQINTVLFHPENFGFMQKVLGISDLYVPGDDDRNKQLREIYELLQGTPQIDPASGMTMPSIQPDSFDNNAICLKVLQAWLKTDLANEIKQTAPESYQNVLAMFNVRKQQADFEAQQTQQPNAQQNGEAQNG